MRHYRLTKKGKQIAKAPVQKRDILLDYLYENKSVSYEELTMVFGKGRIVRMLKEKAKKGLVEEVSDGAF